MTLREAFEGFVLHEVHELLHGIVGQATVAGLVDHDVEAVRQRRLKHRAVAKDRAGVNDLAVDNDVETLGVAGQIRLGISLEALTHPDIRYDRVPGIDLIVRGRNPELMGSQRICGGDECKDEETHVYS